MDDSMCLEELGVRAKSGRRTFAYVGSPSKIPKLKVQSQSSFQLQEEYNDGVEVE